MDYEETHRIAHEKAVRELTAESYLLGDLRGAEAEAFEEHFFDCTVCSAAIHDGAMMLAAGPRAVRDVQPELPKPQPVLPAPLPFKPRNHAWLATAAAATLAFFLGNAAQLMRPVPLMSIATPGAGLITAEVRTEGSNDYVVHFEGDRASDERVLIPDQGFPRYSIELLDGRKIVASAEANARDVHSDQGVPLLIHPLPVGRYQLLVRGVREDGSRPLIFSRSVVVQ
jgi:hypothetical protein